MLIWLFEKLSFCILLQHFDRCFCCCFVHSLMVLFWGFSTQQSSAGVFWHKCDIFLLSILSISFCPVLQGWLQWYFEKDNGMETKRSMEAIYGQCSGISCSFQITVDMWFMDLGSLSRLGRDLLISFIGANFTATNLLKFIPVFKLKLHSVKKVKLNAIFLEHIVLWEVEWVPHAF